METLNNLPASLGLAEAHAGLLLILIILNIALILLVFCTLWAVLRQTSARNKQKGDQPDRAPIMGRLEKIERTLNEFRSEVLKNLLLKSSSAERSAHETEVSQEDAGVSQEDTGQSAPQPEVQPDELEGKLEGEKRAQPQSLASRLRMSRQGLLSALKGIFFNRPALDSATLDELEALLISSDLGVKMTAELMSYAKLELERGKQIDQDSFIALLKQKIHEILAADSAALLSAKAIAENPKPNVILVVGVNGVGKTTTCAKLAHIFASDNLKVLLVAADTFRAAAVQQLETWGQRVGVPVVTGADGAKPATVVFDAMQRAKQEAFDIVIVDTAGRLQNKANLMQELEGIRNAVSRHIPGAPQETLLVLDGTTGQNALSQAREFNSAVPLTGLIVTKLDGTPRGGIVVAIKDELRVPVRFIGVGESKYDLREFDAQAFVEALLDKGSDNSLDPMTDSQDGGDQPISAHAAERRRRRDGQMPGGMVAV